MVTDEDVTHYLANKALLNENSFGLRSRQPNARCGLINAGATCYLNSVIQCMYGSQDFLRAVYSSENGAISHELKALFSHMKYSAKAAVSTQSLQSAFGWSKEEALEQHDVHEFLLQLFQALEKGSLGDISPVAAFEGDEQDIVQCTSCGAEKQASTKFRTLSLEVPDNLETDCNNIVQLLDMFAEQLRSECLDDDNLWECFSCAQKVGATKKRSFQSLPQTMVVQLKRFRFDPISKKKRKLQTLVDFPLSFQSQALQPDGNDTFYLTGVIVHLGSAAGGHYKAYVRSNSGDWTECNDDNVHQLSNEEFNCLLKSGDDLQSANRQSLLENGYLLVYSKSVEDSVEIPLMNEVVQDNTEFENILRLERTRKQLIDAKVSVQHITDLHPLGEVQIMIPNNRTIEDFTKLIYSQCVEKGLIDSVNYSLDHCRVRRLTHAASGKGETFADRQSMCLLDAGFGQTEAICFEIRTDADPNFVEFSVDDMILYIKEWSNIESFSDETQGNQWNEIVVDGKDKATVGTLRSTISMRSNIPSEQLILVPFDKGVPLVVLDDDSADLRKKFKILPGCRIIYEIKTDSCSESVAIHEMKAYRSRVKLFFNNPLAEDKTAYSQSIDSRMDASLSEIKQLLAERLGISVDSFHLKRNDTSPQLKDEAKTLSELDIVDQSILHVEMGKGCNTGEHMLRFELDLSAIDSKTSEAVSRYVLLDELAIPEKFSMLSIKKHLFEQWSDLSEKLRKRLDAVGNSLEIVPPKSANHIRLRDLKNGKPSGPLRDDRLACRCLLGLADGRRICVQLLDKEEIIAGDDILISVRVLSYDKKTISEATDVAIARNSTVQNLLDKIHSSFPELSEPLDGVEGDSSGPLIEIAKGYTTGPALSLKSGLKLKWNDPSIVKEGIDSVVDRPPLNLRDGSIIAIRSRADWLRAQARVRAKKEAASDNDGDVAAGGGISAIRSRLKPTNSQSEPTLVLGGQLPPRPEGSETAETSDDLPQSPAK